MQDIKTDFYKRFSNKCDSAASCSAPAAFSLFGGVKGTLYEVGLSLSFGSIAAYRKRSDGRIMLARSDSDSAQSVNISNLSSFHGADWAAEILTAMKKLPIKPNGFEMLIHSDCGLPSFAPHLLCALTGICDMYGKTNPLDIINAANTKLCYLPSLSGSKVGIVNTLTRESYLYKLKLDNKKIIAVITNKPQTPLPLSKTFAAREDNRTITAAKCLAKGNSEGLATLMAASSDDFLALCEDKKLETLYRLIKDYTKAIRLLPDRSGAACFVNDNLVDEFIAIVGDRYEKKAGARPAFYISD